MRQFEQLYNFKVYTYKFISQQIFKIQISQGSIEI